MKDFARIAMRIRIAAAALCLCPLPLAAGENAAATLDAATLQAQPDVAADGFGPRREKYLLAWAADIDEQHSDFLAVIDANRRSRTYGKVLHTVTLPPGFDRGNEPHAMTTRVNSKGKLFAAGLFSGHVFVFDVHDPLAIQEPKVIPMYTLDYRVPSEFVERADGTVLLSGLAPPSFTNPGGIIEFSPSGELMRSYPVGTDSAANPYGIAVHEKYGRMVTTDFGEPWALFVVDDFLDLIHKTSIRIWDVSKDQRRLLHIIDMPTGERHLASGQDPDQRENLHMRAASFLNHPRKKGFFASAMGGGGLYYCPDVTAAQPRCQLVYDYGFNSGPGSMLISRDDRFLIQAMGTIGHPQGDKRITVLDIRNPYRPRLVDELLVADTTTGGPHMVTFDSAQRRVAWSNYFADDDRIRVKVDGNHRVHIAYFKNGKLTLDTRFRDELDGQPGINFNRMRWPHGESGHAAAHGVAFVDD